MLGRIYCSMQGIFFSNFYQLVQIYTYDCFLRVFKVTGPFVVMIYKMIAGDMIRFMVIYGVFLNGFGLGNLTNASVFENMLYKFAFLKSLLSAILNS